MELNLKIKIKLPKMPNFLIVESSEGLFTGGELDGTGSKESAKISVTRLAPEQIEEVIKLWGEEFRKHCKEKKANDKH